MSRVDTEHVLHIFDGVRDSPIISTLTAIALAALVSSGFENGRKVLQRIFWFLDGMLGGASHNVTLPGPSGFPLVGNLTHVSYSRKSSLGSSDPCV